MAHNLIIVLQGLNTFAIIRFSVQVTPKEAFIIFFPLFIFQYKTISSPKYLYLYQITSSQFKCASIGLLQILHPHGVGIFISPKKYKSAGIREIDPLIFLIFSKLRFLSLIKEESKISEFHFHLYLTQIQDKISKIISISHIFGILFNVTFPFRSKLAPRIGKAAFFEPLICTFPESCFFHLTSNTSFIIFFIKFKLRL
jgi:hypothetical protein